MLQHRIWSYCYKQYQWLSALNSTGNQKGGNANIKFVMSNNRLLVSTCSIALVVAIVLFLLLLRCRYMAQNPGPITRTLFLSVSHTNIRGLVNKMSSIRTALSSYDLTSISETSLSDRCSSGLDIPGFNIYRSR